MRAKSDNVFLISLALENVKHVTYFLCHLDLVSFTLKLIAHTGEEKQQKKEEFEEAEAKSLFQHDNGDLDFVFWRTADVTKLGDATPTSNIGSSNEPVSKDILQIFKHEVSVSVLYAFMGFYVFSVAFSSDFGVVDGTIATLARLDAFVATTNACPRADGSEKFRGHR